MKYKEITIGKTYLIKFDHEDDLLDELKKFFVSQNLYGAVFWILGALKSGKFVNGPKENLLPPLPIFNILLETHEIVGFGNIFFDEKNNVKIHLHVSAGRDKNVITGCLRGSAQVFLTCEVFLVEIKTNIIRKFSEDLGAAILDL